MSEEKKISAVEWLAEKYNYVNWMRNHDEISAGLADEWRKHYLEQAKEMEKQQNGNDFISDVSTRFYLTDNQIETIADLFSRRECLIVEGQDTEWLLSHAFQLGMKAYRDLLNER